MLDENNRLVFIASIFAMSMLALVSFADAIDLFPEAEAKKCTMSCEEKVKKPKKNRG